jgi:hypothetical protein
MVRTGRVPEDVRRNTGTRTTIRALLQYITFFLNLFEAAHGDYNRVLVKENN